jgi:hypothetical protein
MLSEKITLEQVNELLGMLSEYHWEHGEEAYLTFGYDMKGRWLAKNNIDLTEEEYDSLSDLIMGSLRDGEVKQSDIDAYDDEPEPDNRTPDQIHEDRLKEFTPEEIADFGLQAFEIMVDSDYAGKYTFDAIYNGDIIPTMYDGMDEDPVQAAMEANIQLRLDIARRAPEYLALFAIVDRALMNGGKILAADLEKAGTIINSGEDEE